MGHLNSYQITQDGPQWICCFPRACERSNEYPSDPVRVPAKLLDHGHLSFFNITLNYAKMERELQHITHNFKTNYLIDPGFSIGSSRSSCTRGVIVLYYINWSALYGFPPIRRGVSPHVKNNSFSRVVKCFFSSLEIPIKKKLWKLWKFIVIFHSCLR